METTHPPVSTVEPTVDLFAETPVGVLRSMQAYLRELPELLADSKLDRWSVAYCGDERIGLAKSCHDLIRMCIQRGLREDQYYIGIIRPQDEDEWAGLFLH